MEDPGWESSDSEDTYSTRSYSTRSSTRTRGSRGGFRHWGLCLGVTAAVCAIAVFSPVRDAVLGVVQPKPGPTPRPAGGELVAGGSSQPLAAGAGSPSPPAPIEQRVDTHDTEVVEVGDEEEVEEEEEAGGNTKFQVRPGVDAAGAYHDYHQESTSPRVPLPPRADASWGGCFQNQTFYVELSGRHHMPLGERTSESSATVCQARCARTPACEHFSFWNDGGCLLTSYSAYTRRFYSETSTVVAGPRDCADTFPGNDGPDLDLEAVLNAPPFEAKTAHGCGSLHSEYGRSWAAVGETFFDDWQFCELSETHGAEWYLNKTEAFRLGVVEAYKSNAILRVGDQIVPFKRRSVMLRSARAWRPDKGFILAMKYKHVPYGSGIWPAFWLMNSDYLWPQGGELDILEYANDEASKVTFHIDKNCTLDAKKLGKCMNGPDVDQDVVTSCLTNYTSNQLGCKPPQIRRTGQWFAENPGVIATVWDESGVFVFHIPEAEIPPDLASDKPNPNTWERWMLVYLPFDPETCHDIAKPQEIVLNIALCGDWAGGAWYASEQAKSTGFVPPYCIPGHVSEPASDCCTMFMSSPSAENYLKRHAYFDIEYVKVFEPAGTPPSNLSSGSYRNGGEPLASPCIACGDARWIPKGSMSRANVCCPGCENATYYWNDQCQCGGTLICNGPLASEPLASEPLA